MRPNVDLLLKKLLLGRIAEILPAELARARERSATYEEFLGRLLTASSITARRRPWPGGSARPSCRSSGPWTRSRLSSSRGWRNGGSGNSRNWTS